MLADDLLPKRSGAGRGPKITDAELIALAVAQIVLRCHSERRFLCLARQRLYHLFHYIPKQPGNNKRLRADGMPIYFALAPANEGEREVAAAMLESARREGPVRGCEVFVSDKGFAGEEFEQIVASVNTMLIRPDRKGDAPRFDKPGAMSQWIESVYQTSKSELSLEDHGTHPRGSVGAALPAHARSRRWRVAQLAAMGSRREVDAPGRHFIAYDHWALQMESVI